MLRKIAHALWAALLHVAVILTAHQFAERGAEIGLLIRDEWIIGALDHVVSR